MPADAEAIFRVFRRHNTDVLGYPGVTLDGLRDDLAEPGFDPDANSWLGYAPDVEGIPDRLGALLGYPGAGVVDEFGERRT